jgi:hypothetical protein
MEVDLSEMVLEQMIVEYIKKTRCTIPYMEAIDFFYLFKSIVDRLEENLDWLLVEEKYNE